jgi:hypothetical protein
MTMMGDVVSFASGVSLLFFGSLVLIAFRPRRWSYHSGPGYLSRAIFLAALAAVSNTLYWQVLTQPAVASGFVTVYQVRNIGDWLDLLFKGGAAYALFLHLKAMHAQLPPEERRVWSALEMPFYPNRRKCLKLLFGCLRSRNEE